MAGFPSTNTLQTSGASTSVFGRLRDVTNKIIAACWRDVVIGLAVHGNVMAGGPPIDFTVNVWREADLDVLLSVPDGQDQSELKTDHPGEDMLLPSPGDDGRPDADDGRLHPSSSEPPRQDDDNRRECGRQVGLPAFHGLVS